MPNYQLAYDGATIDQKLARLETLLTEFESLRSSFEAMLGNADETEVIDTLNEMKRFFAATKNTETATTLKQAAVDDAVEEVNKNIATVDDLDNLFQ